MNAHKSVNKTRLKFKLLEQFDAQEQKHPHQLQGGGVERGTNKKVLFR